ncbi:MAG TPA: hypothetical protein DHV72_22300 [Serratia grimesii]|uniref:Uncharacterized protein n=1 Tax=Serratia grimesii TaxID=82995 RepID=A0A9C7R2G6_9GAMM|nr:hypothetical protein [Serratia grimesii]HCK02734.1 hypothetical protein [Serratia grimesii]
MHQALRAGKPVNVEITSINLSLMKWCLPKLKLSAEDIIVVSDKAAMEGMIIFGEEAKLWVELASGTLIPAAMAITPELPANAVIGVMVCGGNISHQDMSKWVSYSQSL